MTYSLPRTLALACALGLLGAACSGDSDGFEPGAPIPTDNANSTAEDTTPSYDRDATGHERHNPDDSTTTTTAATSTTDVQDSGTTASVPDTEPEPELATTPQAPGFDFPPADLETDPAAPTTTG